ncbi:hypothetical protein [Nevskia sp.]|uniref:hypothetical protein n=1 Tax=Nevskia sp. TaxID=1929292 RepID=UPI003F72D13F
MSPGEAYDDLTTVASYWRLIYGLAGSNAGKLDAVDGDDLALVMSELLDRQDRALAIISPVIHQRRHPAA